MNYRHFTLSALFIAVLSLNANAASKTKILGTCEVAVSGQSYLIQLSKPKTQKVAQIYRYEFAGIGSETLVPVGAPIPFYDDRFEEGTEYSHNLMDLVSDFEHPNEALLQIAYQANGRKSSVSALITFVNENGERFQYQPGVCDFESSELAE